MNVFEHLYQKTLFPLTFMGVDISITGGAVSLWLAVICSFLFFFLASRSLSLIPGRLQNFAETLIVFLRDEVAGQIEHDRSKWLPFLIALFSFILMNNLLGLVPGLSGATANINVTATLAVIIFLIVQIYGMVQQNPINYLKSFIPPGVPFVIALFLLPVEIISQLARPFSLALRLFANMFAGHAATLLILSLVFIFKSYLIAPLPVVGDVAILSFEIFVAAIQAFIFTYLSALYIATAQEGH